MRSELTYIKVKGVQIPAIGFGTFRMHGEQCVSLLRYALDIGYRHIDTAAHYRNEAEVGRAIREAGISREQLFVATKVPRDKLHRDAVARSLNESLRDLGTDYVDLLLIHWPSDMVPLAETLDAFAELKARGKTRHIGVCNFTVPLLAQAIEEHGADLLTNQVEYHVFLKQDAVLGYVRAHGVALTAHSPLAAGLSPMRPHLATTSRKAGRAIRRIGGAGARSVGKAIRNWLFRPRSANVLGQPSIPHHPELARIGAQYGKSAAQVALRWLIEQDSVLAIPRAANERECRENLEIFDFALTAEDAAAIERLAGGYRVVDLPHAPAWDSEVV